MSITKILIAEHDPLDLELIHHELKKDGIEYTYEVVQTERDYANSLRFFIPDIILSDYSFPSFEGLAAFKIGEAIAPGTPFIFVSGAIGEETSVELIKSGVTDFVLKDKLYTLTTKIKRALREASDRQQKQKTEQELIQSEKRLVRAQQLAHMGSWELDFTSNDIRWSDELYRIYGLPPDTDWHSVDMGLAYTHPDDLDFVKKEVSESQHAGRNFSTNYRIVNKTGSLRHIYSEGRLEFDANGKPMGLYGITHDVTEKVLLENKLALERAARQREITDAVLTAQENERREIGRELHDNLNQILGAAKLYIELAKTDDENRLMFLDKSSGFIVNVIEDIRKISKNMGDPVKHALGLFTSIKILLDDLTLVRSLKIQFCTTGIQEIDINEKLQLNIYRIVQEQLNNILNHAMATRASIHLSRQDNEIRLLISDNGEGCNVLVKNNGVGMINIRSRAELYHGTVTIASKPGEGYKLEAIFPVEDLTDTSTLPAAGLACE